MKKKQIVSWCLYDFANASYSSVIAAVIFPVFYARHIVGGALGDLWWGRAISVSMLLVALSSPFMGGIADRSGMRKGFLAVYTLACVIAVSSFALLKPGSVLDGFLLIVLANTAREGALTFYNSFLPEISEPRFRGRVSGWGFGLGYAGSIAALGMAFPLVKRGMFPAVWLGVAGFLLLFSMPAFFFLPRKDGTGTGGVIRAASEGIADAFKSLNALWVGNSASRRFLLSYLFYADGVNTIIVFSSIFAQATFGFSTGELIILFLVVQITALVGAFGMAKPTDVWGPKRVILMTLFLWLGVSVSAYFAQARWQFWAIASFAGLGLGSVQAASRALFSRFIPPGKESEYFGAYSMIGKTSAILGPLLFGFVSERTGSQRPAVLAVALFFALGISVLWNLREPGV